MVLLKRDNERNEWPVAIIEEDMPDYNGIVRSVKLRIGKSRLRRSKSNFGKTGTQLLFAS